ncbi:14-3-3 protein [Xylariaceae sp. FL0594]|nr:14-3-3 protein [Xylariaceae sp. FL0594]
MASSEVDQKFLGKLAKQVEPTNPLLSSMLFKILGLSINLGEQTVKARKQCKAAAPRTPEFLELYFHILWLSREGLIMLEQYVLPMVGDNSELKVLVHKLRASFYHIVVLFHNKPAVSPMGINTSIAGIPPIPRLDKGKGVDRGGAQPKYPTEGGFVGPPPGFGLPTVEDAGAFLVPSADYLPAAHEYFEKAVALADRLLWGSHPLRLSVKTEYAAFMYECLHDQEGSRKLAQATVQEVYEATEGLTDDMFQDASDLVTVLGKMAKRGLASTNTVQNEGPDPVAQAKADTASEPTESVPATAMDNFI